jgi:transcriptional regulator with XRE-family HTH domain
MDVGNLGDAFRVVMEHTGWSGKRLARELGTSQPWVSMVLSGQRDPGLRRSSELLAQAGWEFQLIPSGDDPVKRREFLLAAAGVTGAAFIPGRSANPYSDPEFIDLLTARLTHNEDQMGGAPLAREALRHATRVVPVAQTGKASLQSAASRLCRQVALILHDARSMDKAEKTATTALAFGRSAGDLTAQAKAYDTLSLITANFQADKGMEYARLGLALPDTPAGDQAILAARLGRAAALSGESYAARGSLEHALELAGNSEPSAEITGNVGIGFTDLGIPGRAGEYLDTAVSLSASSPFMRSLYVSRQAVAIQQASAA